MTTMVAVDLWSSKFQGIRDLDPGKLLHERLIGYVVCLEQDLVPKLFISKLARTRNLHMRYVFGTMH